MPKGKSRKDKSKLVKALLKQIKKKAGKSKKKSKCRPKRPKGCGSRRSWRNPGCAYNYGGDYFYDGYYDGPGYCGPYGSACGPYGYGGGGYGPYGGGECGPYGGPYGYDVPPFAVGPYAAFPCATPLGGIAGPIGPTSMGPGGYMVNTSCIPMF